MLTIKILEDQLVNALQKAAREQQTSVDEIAQTTLRQHLQAQTIFPKSYSFIGIGHSGKGTLSVDVEKILAEATNRQEG